MARRNISLPDELDKQARRARINVSALAQRAVADELDRLHRMAQLDAWLDELDADQGTPSPEAMAAARAWVGSAVPTEPRRTSARKTQTPARRTRRAAS
jgi:post-segregation antitoxin (ccd killing protein)